MSGNATLEASSSPGKFTAGLPWANSSASTARAAAAFVLWLPALVETPWRVTHVVQLPPAFLGGLGGYTHLNRAGSGASTRAPASGRRGGAGDGGASGGAEGSKVPRLFLPVVYLVGFALLALLALLAPLAPLAKQA